MRNTWGDRALRWWLDLVLCGAIVLLPALFVRPATGIDLLGQITLDDRRSTYTDMLQLTTIFAGFSGVMFAIYLGNMSSTGVRLVKKVVGGPLLQVWLVALIAPWVSALTLVVARVVDRGNEGSHNLARWLAVAALALVIVQFVRVVWVFYQLASIELQPERSTVPTAQAPAQVINRRAS